jgi:hypothetical protein
MCEGMTKGNKAAICTAIDCSAFLLPSILVTTALPTNWLGETQTHQVLVQVHHSLARQ